MPTIEEFTRAVESHESIYQISDCVYEQCVEELARIRVSQLNETLENRILRPFLLSWGQMGRVLGNEGPKAVCKRLRSISEEIEPLRKKDLFSIDLERNRGLIIKLFDGLCGTTFMNRKGKRKRVGPTAASKALHLVCPDLFIMWDSKIRIKYGRQGVGHEYFEFLKDMKDVADEVNTAIEHLEKTYGRRPTKLLDEYNWITR